MLDTTSAKLNIDEFEITQSLLYLPSAHVTMFGFEGGKCLWTRSLTQFRKTKAPAILYVSFLNAYHSYMFHNRDIRQSMPILDLF